MNELLGQQKQLEIAIGPCQPSMRHNRLEVKCLWETIYIY